MYQMFQSYKFKVSLGMALIANIEVISQERDG
jgi:hypothetical protein